MNKNTTFYAIGSRIKKTRLERGLTQAELAKRLGYKSQTTINKIEKGLVNLSVDKLIEFAKALNVSYSYLSGESEDKKRTLWDETWEEIRNNPTNQTTYAKGNSFVNKCLGLTVKQKELLELLADKLSEIDDDIRQDEIKSFIEFKFMK